MSGENQLVYAPAPFVDKNGVMIPIKYACGNGYGVGVNQALLPIPAAGKICRVLSLTHWSSGGGTVMYTTSTGGTPVFGQFLLAAGAAPQIFPYQICGWFQTLPGDQLLITVTGVNYLYCNLAYIEYTPIG